MRAALVLVLVLASGSAHAQAQRIPLASLDHACALFGKRLKSVNTTDCVNAGLRTSPTPSVAGQPLLWRDYRPRTVRADQQRILLIGGSHGDEFSSVSIIFKWMQRLNEDRFQPFLWANDLSNTDTVGHLFGLAWLPINIMPLPIESKATAHSRVAAATSSNNRAFTTATAT